MIHAPTVRTRRTLAVAAALLTATSVAVAGTAAAQTTPPVPAPSAPAPAPSVPAPSTPPGTPAPGRPVTSAAEKALLDAVPAQTLTWAPCADDATAECSTLKTPLSWEKPAGEQIDLRVMRRKATEKSVGPLVVHYGASTSSTASFVRDAGSDLDPALTKRFDLVGLQTRGLTDKPTLRCFTTFAESEFNTKALRAVPQSGAEWESSLEAAGTLGRACAERSKGYAETLSVWSQARDHELLRRVLGEEKLSFSVAIYGAIFGQVYASMFPERVRALAIDVPWDGGSYLGANAGQTAVESLQLGAAMHNVFASAIRLCEEAGVAKCSFAGPKGTTWKKAEAVFDAMKTTPVPVGGGSSVGFVDFISSLDFQMRDGEGFGIVMDALQEAHLSLQGTRAARGGALDTLAQRVAASKVKKTSATRQEPDEYNNDTDLYAAYVCNGHPLSFPLAQFPAEHRKLTKKYPFVGAPRLEEEFTCASDAWSLKPSQPYAGTLGVKLTTPPLIISNGFNLYSHPAQAQRVAQRFPGSAVVSGPDVWGVGPERNRDRCFDDAVATYLITGVLPTGDKLTCKATWKPFDGSPTPPSENPRRGPLFASPGYHRLP